MARPAPHTIVLVEGRSDTAALDALATRYGRDLARDGVHVVLMNGATNVDACLRRSRDEARVLALCDAGEARLFTRAGIATEDCFVCIVDLEDELIRAAGIDAMLRVVDEQGQLKSFRTMQKQPAQRGRPIDAQLRRFIGSRSGHKVRYARLLVGAVELHRVPTPLAALFERLDSVGSAAAG